MNDYKHHFLVAMPQMQGEFFARSVVYIYEHSLSGGTVGFTINKPLTAVLRNVLEHLKLSAKTEKIAALPVYSGGPVGTDQGFIIHDRMTLANKKDDESITIGTSRQILKDIADGNGPDNFIVTLGYAGWGPAQLETEIERNDWLIVPFDKTLLFETPISTRWTAAAKLLGVDFNQLSSQTGHA